MRYFESQETKVVFVVLTNGEGLLESIRAVAKEAAIHTGVLLSGIGSLQKGRIHTVASNNLPPKEAYLDLPGPLEVSNYTGIIADYEPHVHITFMDVQGRVYGGHLEEGCEVLTLAEFSILRVPGYSPGSLQAARRSVSAARGGEPVKEISVALAGIGGYGNIYARALLGGAQEHGVRLAAGIESCAAAGCILPGIPGSRDSHLFQPGEFLPESNR